MHDPHRAPRPLPPRAAFFRHMAGNAGVAASVIAGSLAMGAAGYHWFEHLAWIDAVLNAAMILTGMGPVTPLATTGGKLFGIFYALFSGIVCLSMVALLLAPALKRLLHRMHVQIYGDRRDD